MSSQDYQYDEGGGDEFPPYKEDFFQRITDVSWAVGQAVDFAKSAYLALSSGLSLNKATISFWFRVPQATMQAASNSWDNNFGPDYVLTGIVPLITWGPTTTSTITGFGGEVLVTNTEGPSQIGIFCADLAEFPANLALRFQSNNLSTLTDYILSDPPQVDSTRTEGNYYAIGPQGAILEYSVPWGSAQIDVSGDAWHHLLLSYDVSGPQGKLWLVLDDRNYADKYLWPAATINMVGYDVDGLGGPNDITATYDWPLYQVGPPHFNNIAVSGGFDMPTAPLGTPLQANMVQYSLGNIELAELQIFIGISMDVSSESVRRAFIGPPGKSSKKSGLIPVDPKQAQKLMGKKPELLLHGSGNWIKGKNTGSDPQLQFAPSGTIKSYKPEPQLGK